MCYVGLCGLLLRLMIYLVVSQLLLEAIGSVPVSAYRISVGVEHLDPSIILRIDLLITSSFLMLDLLEFPYAISP